MEDLVKQIKDRKVKRDILSISMDKEIILQLKDVCKKEEVKVSQVVEVLIRDFINSRSK